MKDDFTEGSFTKPIGEQEDELAELRECSKLEEKIREADKDIKENRRNRIKGVLEKFAFELVDFNTSDEYKKALKIALDKLEEIK